MFMQLRERIAYNLKKPRKDVVGWVVSKFVLKKNVYLEENAARLCKIRADDKVLEIGCGPGYGLAAAYQYIKGGKGKIYGLDLSPYMVEVAGKRCRQMIRDKKVEIVIGNVINLPYNTDTFDSVFHVNSFYFWPVMKSSLREIYRVMKPGAAMVATMNSDSLRQAESRGFLKHAYPDPLKFMVALENVGFENVRIEYLKNNNKSFQAIFAEIKDKPAYDEDELSDENIVDNKNTENHEKIS